MSQRKKTKENKQPKNIPVGDKTRGQDDSPNNTIFDRIIAKDVELSRMCSVCAGETSSYGFMRPVMKILEYSCHGIPWLFGTAIAIFMTHKAYLHEKQINLFIGFLFDLLVSFVLKMMAKRPRPAENQMDMFATVSVDKFSFPSGHATRAGLLLVFLLTEFPLGFPFDQLIVMWLLTVCVSRVLLGRHHISDVVCGAIIATEAHDDDGLPHTLEHLVFMGSEKYPYKGVLDLLANRCLASGTNAWTDTDHTCYTMTTAGSEGFLNLLPIYMDHVLYPTLTEAGYTTEVHHVSGEGEDAGVVYCEMQGRENTSESLASLAMLRNMYPGHCGYKSETGGIMENLRTSTSHKKVCDYHRAFYRPDNLCLIITGQVTPEQVFAVLKPFEEKILSKGSLPSFTRPWQSAVPPLENAVEKKVTFPSDDEESGMVSVGWRGPKAKEQYEMTAMLIVLEYLTDTAVAPLQRDFVEIEDPFCSDVAYSIIENSDSMAKLKFKNVPMAKLGAIKDRLFALLSNLSDRKEEIDMSRMESVIHRRLLEALNSLEDNPHDTVAFHIIGDFLYGDTNEDLDTRLNQLDMFKKLKKENQDFWVNFVKKYFCGPPYVCIIGEPSSAMMKEMGDTEKQRVVEQRKTLGEKGLAEKAKALEEATQDNEKEPPEEMLTCVDVPDVGCIHFHKVQPSSNHGNADVNKAFPLANIPFTFQLDDMQTNFVDMNVLMESSGLSGELRKYLPLYSEVILESPVIRDGKVISHEDIITELAADTLENSCCIGIQGGRFTVGKYGSLVHLALKVEEDKYTKGVNWLRELMYQVQFTEERLKIVASKMVNEVASMKRRGPVVTKCVMKDLLFNKDSNEHLCSMLRQFNFLNSIQNRLEKEEEARQVIADLEKVREHLTRPENFRVHVAACTSSLGKLGEPQAVWKQEFLPKACTLKEKRTDVKQAYEYMFPPSEGPGSGLIVGVGSVESNFLMQCTPSVNDFQHPDLPAIMVYVQYLTQLEGPMWRQIRGLGLSYHYSMYVKPEAGLLYFILFKSTHLVNAYKQGKEIVDDHISGKTPYSEVEFEACKSSLIFEIIEEEKTPSDASHESMLSYLKGVSKDYNRDLIQKIPKVTLEDLKRVGPQYIAPIFDTSKSKVAICCHPTKVKEICTDMKGLSKELKVIESMEDSFLAEM